MRTHIKPIDFVPANSRLTFIRQTSESGYDENGKRISFPQALYKCECNEIKELSIWNVKSGKTISCGCYRKKFISQAKTIHGLSQHPLFRIWAGMKNRCEKPKNKSYPYYGAIGIVVCDEWRNEFMPFYNWAIENGWRKGLEIDRMEGYGNYSPNNCRIVTHKVNCGNRRNRLDNQMIELNGIIKSVVQWEKDLGFPKRTIYSRTIKGWSIERILTTPIRSYLT